MRPLVCAILTVMFVVAATASAGDITLPAPEKVGGPPLFAAIDRRASAPGNAFPSGVPSMQDLSTVLWAATGLNRDGNKWTVPMALGKEPYCTVYVTLDSGTYRYNWRKNILEFVTKENINASVPAQSFARNAPVALYVVLDAAALAAIPNQYAGEFGPLLAGAMSQNIYLACEGLDMGTRLVYSIDREETARKLGLQPGDAALFVMPLGKRR